MKWIFLFMFLAFGGQTLLAQSEPTVEVQVDESLTKSLEQVILDVKTIRPGMTRGQLLKLFTTDGGISTRSWQVFVYKKCLLIKVKVEFEKPSDEEMGAWNTVDDEGVLAGDIISTVSEPFLQFRIVD